MGCDIESDSKLGVRSPIRHRIPLVDGDVLPRCGLNQWQLGLDVVCKMKYRITVFGKNRIQSFRKEYLDLNKLVEQYPGCTIKIQPIKEDECTEPKK